MESKENSESVLCTWCGEKLSDEEAENPRKDGFDELICDDCYEENYMYICCECEEYEEKEHQHNMVVVFNEAVGVPKGTYKIKNYPYYSQPLIGEGELFPYALERIGDIPVEADSGGYSCGHLCASCQEKIVKESLLDS